MQPSRIIVVGASAGGVEAFKALARGLAADFPAALLLVLHIPPQVPSLLPGILDRCGPLPAVQATDGAAIEAGHIYVAAPDRHLLTCPECHGVLSEIKEDTFVRFRCHTGHAYSMQALLADVENSLDSSLWRVLKTLHERALLLREAADLARRRNDATHAQVLESRATECEAKSRIIREMLQDPTVSEHDPGTRLDVGMT